MKVPPPQTLNYSSAPAPPPRHKGTHATRCSYFDRTSDHSSFAHAIPSHRNLLQKYRALFTERQGSFAEIKGSIAEIQGPFVYLCESVEHSCMPGSVFLSFSPTRGRGRVARRARGREKAREGTSVRDEWRDLLMSLQFEQILGSFARRFLGYLPVVLIQFRLHRSPLALALICVVVVVGVMTSILRCPATTHTGTWCEK